MNGFDPKAPRGVDLPMPVGNDEAKIFSGPKSLEDRFFWREELHKWKKTAYEKMYYDDKNYSKSKYNLNSNFNMALVWLWDELLFDFDLGEFTPKKFLNDAEKYGGIDGIILWHAYPVIGIDARNQFDFYNEVPGLPDLVSNLQKLGVKVYLNYNPWDRWTNRAENSDQIEIANLVSRMKFDGIFLDTMKSADPDFMAPIKSVNSEIIIAGESRVQQERICDHVMSWAQWFGDSDIPGVIRAKWFEPRHMLHQTRRWNRSHIDELHIAWINGAGMLLWEVVFGSWVGWRPREAQMWKEMVAILRKHSNLLTDWEPLSKLTDEAEDHQLYASKFGDDSMSLFTIINKNVKRFTGEILPGIYGSIPGNGVGAILKSNCIFTLLDFTYEEFKDVFPDQKLKRFSDLKGLKVNLEIEYRNRECGLFEGAPFVDIWKPLPPNFHQIFTADLIGYVRTGILGNSEVTNEEFFEFIEATQYKPKDLNRFLNHWHKGQPLLKDLQLPVTHVDLDDAQAYAAWSNTVIPNEFEWQYYSSDRKLKSRTVWSLTDSVQTDGRTRFLILKGGSNYSIRNEQGARSTSGIAESDWYVDGGPKDPSWVEKLLLMGQGMSRSENIGFTTLILNEGH